MSSDAAHLALPFAGEGANLVMYDGAELSNAIAASLGDPEAALLACKRNLFPPSASAAVEAGRNLKLCFGNNVPQSQLDLFTNDQPSNNCLTKRERAPHGGNCSTRAKWYRH
jgi:2-polyprenyl-6-methoxyphenol hydroxylase-like FAD-dependent oxidoreductase